MKSVNKLTFCAIIAALSVAFMLLSYFPYLTYAIPALSGLFIMVTVIEIDIKWAIATFATAATVLLISPADMESKALFICFFGFYPILKAVIEKIRKSLIEWIVKFVVFNAVIALLYFIFTRFTGFSLEEFAFLGKYGAVIFLAIVNVTFAVYDIAVSRVSMFYIVTFHSKIKKLLVR